VLSSLGNPAEEGSDAFHLTAAVGRLWIEGQQIDPARLFAGQERRRVSLPAYAFERLRYWIEPDRVQPAPQPAAAAVTAAARPSVAVSRTPAQTLHPRPRLATPFVAPRGEMEERIAELWRRVLGVAEVGIYDSFLDLGGHSLLATQMLSQLREEMQVDLPIEEMFADPTVAGVAAAAVEAQAAASSLAEIQAMSDSELEAELAGARDGRDTGGEHGLG
jgi:acyl transferase domain-containing protein